MKRKELTRIEKERNITLYVRRGRNRSIKDEGKDQSRVYNGGVLFEGTDEGSC